MVPQQFFTRESGLDSSVGVVDGISSRKATITQVVVILASVEGLEASSSCC